MGTPEPDRPSVVSMAVSGKLGGKKRNPSGLLDAFIKRAWLMFATA
jgi:hypothetical protein